MDARLASWYEEERSALARRGLEVTLGQSPPDGRNKSSAWVRVIGLDRAAEIIVWDSGECELWGPRRAAPESDTDPRAEHRQLNTEADFLAAIDRVLSIFDG